MHDCQSSQIAKARLFIFSHYVSNYFAQNQKGYIEQLCNIFPRTLTTHELIYIKANVDIFGLKEKFICTSPV